MIMRHCCQLKETKESLRTVNRKDWGRNDRGQFQCIAITFACRCLG